MANGKGMTPFVFGEYSLLFKGGGEHSETSAL